VLVSRTVAIADADPAPDAILARLDAQAPFAFAWRDGPGDRTVVGLDRAWTAPGSGAGLPAWPQAEAAWQALLAEADVEAAGGVGPALCAYAPFDPGRTPVGRVWSRFGGGGMVLPRVVFTSVGGVVYRTENRLVGADGEPWCDEAAPAYDLGRAYTAAGAGAGDPDAWRALVGAAAEAIAAGDLAKVVAARSRDVRFGADPVAIVRRLARRQPDAFTYAVVAGGATFCGATPELLVRVDGERVESLCLAGTTARGGGRGEDARLGRDLRASVKERSEHALVREAVVASLARTCEAVTIAAEPSLRALRDLQHLASPVSARLRPGFGVLDVACDLHPTPAVAGAPRQAALDWLRAREDLDRGLFGGPVGLLGADGDGTLAIALRCGLLDPDAGVARLFAGCGLVAGSDADREWQETELKMRVMQAALDGERDREGVGGA